MPDRDWGCDVAITAFNNVTDGLDAAARDRGHFIARTALDETGVWIPYAEGVWVQPCHFNVTTGGFTVLL